MKLPKPALLTWMALSLAGCASSRSDPSDQDAPDDAAPECYGTQDCSDRSLCVFGRCVLDPAECRASQVTCDDAPPTCDTGRVPSVDNGCWGDCVPLLQCNYLDTCQLCSEQNRLCLHFQGGDENVFHCGDAPAACDPLACECLAEDICGPLTCVDVVDETVACQLVGDARGAAPSDSSRSASSPMGADEFEGAAQPGDFGNPSSLPMDSFDPEAPPPSTVIAPEEDSYLDGRGGADCALCGWQLCDKDVTACLASEECSHWHGCVFFCEGLDDDAQDACEIDCFDGDRALRDRTFSGLACLVTECCGTCGAPCP